MRIFAPALTVVAPAQEVPQRPPQRSEQQPSAQLYGSIEGKVTDRRSGEPLGKARVGVRSVEAASSSTSPNLYLPANTSPMVEAATDDAGMFRLKNLPPGTYRIIAGRDGFVDLEYGSSGPLLLGTPVRVLPGQ